MNENIKQLQNDPEFQLLVEVDRVLQGSKIWGGMEWTYHPIHPVKYTALIEKVRERINNIYEKHGVKNNGC